MARNTDMDADDSAARLNGRRIGDEDDVRAAIAWEMARHEKLFDDIWDRVMKASSEEIAVMLADADVFPPSCDGQPGRQGAPYLWLGAVRKWSEPALGLLAAGVEAARRFLVDIEGSAHGRDRRVWVVSAVSVIAVMVIFSLIVPNPVARHAAGAAAVDSGGGAPDTVWRYVGGGTPVDLSLRTDGFDVNFIRPTVAVATAAVKRPVPATAPAGNAALLVTPLLAQSATAMPVHGIQNPAPEDATAEAPRPPALQTFAAQTNLAMVALNAACSEGKGQIECTLSSPNAVPRRVALSEGLVADFRNWYFASPTRGSSVVCVIGPGAALPECREVPRSSEPQADVGALPTETLKIGMWSGLHLPNWQSHEKPVNP